MERRGEESMDLSSPQESPAELFSGQQHGSHGGSSIFSPAQTLDPQPAALVHNGTTPNSDPPISASDSMNQPPSPQPPPSGGATTRSSSITYKECLKNHAAGMGGHVVDGCGEFMPAGDPNTPQSLRCAACDCHRNFHRREAEGSQTPAPLLPFHSYAYTPNSGQTPMPTHPQPHFRPGGPMPPTMMSFGGAAMESSSEDLNIFQSSHGRHAMKKRFRTKFSQDQKDRMHEFAAKIDWRLQKQDEQEVQEFCSQVGVKRKAFKVWMHNNKQAIKKKTSQT